MANAIHYVVCVQYLEVASVAKAIHYMLFVCSTWKLPSVAKAIHYMLFVCSTWKLPSVAKAIHYMLFVCSTWKLPLWLRPYTICCMCVVLGSCLCG